MDQLSRALVVVAVMGCIVAMCSGAHAYSGQWCKAQYHVHSFRDDGNTHPEVALERYRAQGYALASLTHHWPDWQTAIGIQWAHDGGSLDAATAEYVAQLPDRPGIADSGDGGGWIYRVPTHDEIKAYFEGPRDGGPFIVTAGQEGTPSGTYTRAHVLGLGLAAPVSVPASGVNYAATFDATVSVLRDAGAAAEAGITTPITVVAHPNWYDAGLAADLRHLDIQGIEIYSGHSHTLPHGGGPDQMTPPAVRVTWDLINRWRLTQGLPLVWGFASDDAHDYYGSTVYPRAPNRAWVAVECDASPTEAELLLATEAGEFYASTGATLTEYTVTTSNGARCLTVTAAGARDRVRVIGVLRDDAATVPWREITSARGGVTEVCPNPGTFGLARVEVFAATGGRAWTQHVRLWQGDDP